MRLKFDEIPLVVILKKRSSELLVANMFLNIILAFWIVNAGDDKWEKERSELREEIRLLKEEVYLPRHQLGLFEDGRIRKVMAHARALENYSVSPDRFEQDIPDSDRVSRQQVLQGLVYQDHLLLCGLDGAARDHNLPSFRDLQWKSIMNEALLRDKSLNDKLTPAGRKKRKP